MDEHFSEGLPQDQSNVDEWTDFWSSLASEQPNVVAGFRELQGYDDLVGALIATSLEPSGEVTKSTEADYF